MIVNTYGTPMNDIINRLNLLGIEVPSGEDSDLAKIAHHVNHVEYLNQLDWDWDVPLLTALTAAPHEAETAIANYLVRVQHMRSITDCGCYYDNWQSGQMDKLEIAVSTALEHVIW